MNEEPVNEREGEVAEGAAEDESFKDDKFYKFAKGKGIMNLPNKLTISRMVLIPVFELFFYLQLTGHFFVALVGFAVASLTFSTGKLRADTIL